MSIKIENESLEFLKAVYRETTTKGWLNIFGIHHISGRKGEVKSLGWFDLAQPDALEQAAQLAKDTELAGRYDVYYGVCTAKAPKNGNLRVEHGDALEMSVLYLDVDTMQDPDKVEKYNKAITAGNTWKAIPDTVDQARELLDALEVPPSILVGSGHGLHAYWLLSSPVDVTSWMATREKIDKKTGELLTETVCRDDAPIKEFARAVTRAIGMPGIDAHASEPARVLRVPGTMNRKSSPVEPVKLLKLDQDKRYSLDDLMTWAAKYPAPAPVPATDKADKIGKREQARRLQAVNAALAGTYIASTEGTDAASSSGDVDPYAEGGPYYLPDDVIISTLASGKGKNGERVAALWQGDTSGYESPSEADLALCNALAFWTRKDPARMDDFFRQSGLYREKWDDKHGAQTYGEMTIAAACETTYQVYTAKEERNLMLLESKQRAALDQVRKVLKHSPGNYDVFPGKPGSHGGGMALIKNVEVQMMFSTQLVPQQLADWLPWPVASTEWDDGAGGHEITYTIAGWRHDWQKLPALDVPASDLADFDRWMAPGWGADVVIQAGKSTRDQVRECLQYLIRGLAKHVRAYTCTGWQKVGDKWVYLHGGGAIGTDDLITVQLPGGLERYNMATADSGADIPAAIRASLSLLDVGKRSITIPVACQTYLAPLVSWLDRAGHTPQHTLMLYGRTQTRKSTIAAIYLSHYWMYDTKLPVNFDSTANGIREMAFALRDSVLVIDNFDPSTTGAARDRKNDLAQAIGRMYGDHAIRQRMRSDLKLASSKPARGLAIMTGESLPQMTESGESRYFAVRVDSYEDIPLGERLNKAEDQAADGTFMVAMRAYLAFLAQRANENYDGMIAYLGKRYRELRSNLQAASGTQSRGRLGESAAGMLLAMELWLTAAVYYKAIDQAAADELKAETRTVLLASITDQAGTVANSDPVSIFCGTLAEIWNDPELFGNRGKDGHGDFYHNEIGWRVQDILYVKPSMCYAKVASIVSMPIPARELWRRMWRAGITTTERAEVKAVPRSSGKKERVLGLKVDEVEKWADAATTSTTDRADTDDGTQLDQADDLDQANDLDLDQADDQGSTAETAKRSEALDWDSVIDDGIVPPGMRDQMCHDA